MRQRKMAVAAIALAMSATVLWHAHAQQSLGGSTLDRCEVDVRPPTGGDPVATVIQSNQTDGVHFKIALDHNASLQMGDTNATNGSLVDVNPNALNTAKFTFFDDNGTMKLRFRLDNGTSHFQSDDYSFRGTYDPLGMAEPVVIRQVRRGAANKKRIRLQVKSHGAEFSFTLQNA